MSLYLGLIKFIVIFVSSKLGVFSWAHSGYPFMIIIKSLRVAEVQSGYFWVTPKISVWQCFNYKFSVVSLVKKKSVIVFWPQTLWLKPDFDYFFKLDSLFSVNTRRLPQNVRILSISLRSIFDYKVFTDFSHNTLFSPYIFVYLIPLTKIWSVVNCKRR